MYALCFFVFNIGTEILLKVALNTINQTNQSSNNYNKHCDVVNCSFQDGDYEKIEKFLHRRSDCLVSIDIKDKRTGNTPLIWAAKRGHTKVIIVMKKSLHSNSKQFHQINKWSITSHLHSLNTKKKTMTYDVGNAGPGLEQAQKCGRVRPVNGIPTITFW